MHFCKRYNIPNNKSSKTNICAFWSTYLQCTRSIQRQAGNIIYLCSGAGQHLLYRVWQIGHILKISLFCILTFIVALWQKLVLQGKNKATSHSSSGTQSLAWDMCDARTLNILLSQKLNQIWNTEEQIWLPLILSAKAPVWKPTFLCQDDLLAHTVDIEKQDSPV